MQLTFHGAAGMVTGSCFLLEAAGRRILIDCGLFQGSKALNERNYGPFPFDPKSIDMVLLTHAHIDHSGLLPKLVRHGFQGPIYTTTPTKDLLEIMLTDSAYIQEAEVRRLNKRRARQRLPLLEPIYTTQDAQGACRLVKTRPFHQPFVLAPNLTACFWPAGHMLGAASITIEHRPKGGKPHRIAFSGDLGVQDHPLVVDVSPLPAVDTLVMESTYGARARVRNDDRYEKLAQIIRDTFAKGGNVIIPAFAVGRVQDLLYGLHRMIHDGELDPAKIFVDSPLAAKATDIFCRHVEEFDEEARRFSHIVGDCPLYLRDLRITQSVDESKALNDIESGAVIISSSGMCEAGRIKHHLRHQLWRPECSVVIVSYQAEGTLGRRLVDGAETVRIHGRTVKVAAQIHNLEGFSAHADQQELIDWVKQMPKPPGRIFLVHGEPEARETLGRLLEEQIKVPVFAPELDDRVDLTSKEIIGVPRARQDFYTAPSFAHVWETISALRHDLDRLERAGASAKDVDSIAAALADARQAVQNILSGRASR